MQVSSKLKSAMTLAAMIGYFAIGILQLAAIFVFFNDVWNWWAVFSFLAAFFIAYIPLLGAAVGTYAAYEVWQWHWYWAFLLFFWPIVLLGVVQMLVVAASAETAIRDKLNK